jgi:transposase
MSVYVGIEVHRKRSQVAVVTEDGQVQVNRNVVNGMEPILKVIGDLPAGTQVAFEAAYGWGWLVELLEDYGFDPHLVHPLRCKAIASARLKNDKVDTATLAQLLRADLLPEAWIAPKDVRQLRALLRHRVALVRLGTGLRNRIHAVAADHGYDRPGRQWTGAYWTGPGRQWLAELPLPAASRQVITDSLGFIDAVAPIIDRLDRQLHARAKADPRVKLLVTGVGARAADGGLGQDQANQAAWARPAAFSASSSWLSGGGCARGGSARGAGCTGGDEFRRAQGGSHDRIGWPPSVPDRCGRGRGLRIGADRGRSDRQ